MVRSMHVVCLNIHCVVLCCQSLTEIMFDEVLFTHLLLWPLLQVTHSNNDLLWVKLCCRPASSADYNH